jgi:hypothetical protein
MSNEFLAMVYCHSLSMLDNIIPWTSRWCHFTFLRQSSSPNSGLKRASLGLLRPKSMPQADGAISLQFKQPYLH